MPPAHRTAPASLGGPRWPGRPRPESARRVRASSAGAPLGGEIGWTFRVCPAGVHDRAMARLVAGPLATAAALAVAGAQAEPLLGAAGPGFRDSTRLAETPADLAME